jgi:hypothetical protein
MRPSWSGRLAALVLLALVTTSLVTWPRVVEPFLLVLAALVSINARVKQALGEKHFRFVEE